MPLCDVYTFCCVEIEIYKARSSYIDSRQTALLTIVKPASYQAERQCNEEIDNIDINIICYTNQSFLLTLLARCLIVTLNGAALHSWYWLYCLHGCVLWLVLDFILGSYKNTQYNKIQ